MRACDLCLHNIYCFRSNANKYGLAALVSMGVGGYSAFNFMSQPLREICCLPPPRCTHPEPECVGQKQKTEKFLPQRSGGSTPYLVTGRLVHKLLSQWSTVGQRPHANGGQHFLRGEKMTESLV